MDEIKCEECVYYDKENENCSYLSCDGIDCDDAPCGFPYLTDFYKYEPGDDGEIIIDGKLYQYEINLSQSVPDDRCCRVFIDGKYFYFG